MRYCSLFASIQKTVSIIGLGDIWAVFGVRMSVVVRRMGKDGVAFADRNSRWTCERTRGVFVVLSMDASWKTSEDWI
jgi:hypothetical protein